MKVNVSLYRRVLAVLLFLALLLAIAEISGLREHFNLPYLRDMLGRNRLGVLAIFVFLFSFANLIHIPGALFLVAAILRWARCGVESSPMPPPSFPAR